MISRVVLRKMKGPVGVEVPGGTDGAEATGPVHVELACRDQAEALALAYVEGRPLPTIKTLAEKDIFGNQSLCIVKAPCQVSLIAQRRLPNVGATTFDWQRPLTEVARSTGGPLIACAKPWRPRPGPGLVGSLSAPGRAGPGGDLAPAASP